MSVYIKAICYHFIAMSAGLAIEMVVINAAIHFEMIALLFVLGPLALFLGVFLWVNRITGIRCPYCNNIYGVSIGSRGWPSVPPKCLSRGYVGK